MGECLSFEKDTQEDGIARGSIVMGAVQWREWGANGVSAKKGRKALFDVSFGRRSLLGCDFGMRAIVPSLECLGLPRMRSVLVRAHSGPSRPEWVCMVLCAPFAQ